jgi:hypothetical protein
LRAGPAVFREFKQAVLRADVEVPRSRRQFGGDVAQGLATRRAVERQPWIRLVHRSRGNNTPSVHASSPNSALRLSFAFGARLNVVLVCRSACTYNGRSGTPGKVAPALVDRFPALHIPISGSTQADRLGSDARVASGSHARCRAKWSTTAGRVPSGVQPFGDRHQAETFDALRLAPQCSHARERSGFARAVCQNGFRPSQRPVLRLCVRARASELQPNRVPEDRHEGWITFASRAP